MNKSKAYRKLDELMRLPHNWDGYGSIRLDMDIYKNAKWVIKNLPVNIIDPFISPCAGGKAIQLEWEAGSKKGCKRELELDISATKVGYLKILDDIGKNGWKTEEGEIKITIDKHFLTLLNNLTNWLSCEE